MAPSDRPSGEDAGAGAGAAARDGHAPVLVHHTVQVPATTANLGAGFDAFGLALTQHLVARTVPRAEAGSRIVALDGGHGVPTDDDNLIWRSLVAFCELHAVPVPDVAVHVRSTIPLERGMGSSSAAIVAGLTLARELSGLSLADRAIVELATEIEGHPDNVAPAVLGGLVACARDDAGNLVVRRVNPAPQLRPLLLVPEHRQATATARAVLPDAVPLATVADQAARAGHVLAALTGVWPAAAGLSGDHLHEPARAMVMPASAALLTDLRRQGHHAWLSGAGPSVAVAVRRGDHSAEAAVAAGAGAHGFVCRELDWELSGARSCPDDGCGLAGTRNCMLCPRQRL